jgi:hypothetical protein
MIALMEPIKRRKEIDRERAPKQNRRMNGNVGTALVGVRLQC